ncbi:alpha/beta family hydrolase [Mesorhizobium sp. IMUNJ 23232]|uniref:alpha/beta hydrolase family protein n=1 Tax=Mesorhizobium sp. IMUNJ 23232 TaxID=3376064 RepID=UPI00379848CD
MMPDFLSAGPADASTTLLLAHGAGAPMDSAWMNAIAEKLAEQQVRTVRFEFGYMAARREGQRKPPPRGETLMPEYVAAVEGLGAKGKLFIGGKSLGGRVASMVAEGLFHDGKIAGLVCLGYPFHPPGQSDKLRTKHLESLDVTALICQGTRDPFGTREEVTKYGLSRSIEMFWLEDGDHDFKPRKPYSLDGHLSHAAEKIGKWATET